MVVDGVDLWGGGGVLWYLRGYKIWDLGFRGQNYLGFGENIWDLRLIKFNILSEIHILFIYKTLDIG